MLKVQTQNFVPLVSNLYLLRHKLWIVHIFRKIADGYPLFRILVILPLRENNRQLIFM